MLQLRGHIKEPCCIHIAVDVFEFIIFNCDGFQAVSQFSKQLSAEAEAGILSICLGVSSIRVVFF
jgi:hypothetical protein